MIGFKPSSSGFNHAKTGCLLTKTLPGQRFSKIYK